MQNDCPAVSVSMSTLSVSLYIPNTHVAMVRHTFPFKNVRKRWKTSCPARTYSLNINLPCISTISSWPTSPSTVVSFGFLFHFTFVTISLSFTRVISSGCCDVSIFSTIWYPFPGAANVKLHETKFAIIAWILDTIYHLTNLISQFSGFVVSFLMESQGCGRRPFVQVWSWLLCNSEHRRLLLSRKRSGISIDQKSNEKSKSSTMACSKKEGEEINRGKGLAVLDILFSSCSGSTINQFRAGATSTLKVLASCIQG